MGRVPLTTLLLCFACAIGGASTGNAEPLRIALIIANVQYASFPGAARCGPSAAAARDAFRSAGFEVVERNNLGRGEFDTAVGMLARRITASPPAVAAFYYCGYAAQFNSRSFLLPVSAALARDHDVLTQGIVVKSIVDSLRRAPESGGLVLLDLFALPGSALGGPGQVGQQVPASGFAVVAATNDGPGEGVTSLSAALRDELAARTPSVGNAVSGLRRRIAKDAVTAEFISATSDAALMPESKPKDSPPPNMTPPAASADSHPAAAAPQRLMVEEERMSEADRREVQTALAALGYYAGLIDATFGPETRAAIRRYQFEIKAERTGRMTAEQATRLVNGVR